MTDEEYDAYRRELYARIVAGFAPNIQPDRMEYHLEFAMKLAHAAANKMFYLEHTEK